MYEALGVKDIDLILKPKPPMLPKDPALEHIDALGGMPFRAYPGQDHRAHITSHLNFMATNMARSAPMMTAAVEKNCLEHISLMAQEQIELEFREELKQIQQHAMGMQQNPQMKAAANTPEMQQIHAQIQQTQQKIEARKAVLIAEMTEDYMKEEKKVTSQFDHDPIAKLRARELDIRALDNEAKRKEAEKRLNLENMKAMMNQDIQETKIDQNEELAELRADTSIEKQEMANENRIKVAKMKPKTK
jgi:N-methylhydantoinase A/oxoprolinase/acetone carboxylase beta subunit